MAAVLRRVVMAPEVGSRTILGALSVYAVLGILFTFVYGVIDRIQGGPFFEGHPHPAGSDFLFFSYTTLTTTGYGNLVPGGQPGRLISGLEMMIGQIFLVTLVAGLVSLWRPGEGDAAPARGQGSAGEHRAELGELSLHRRAEPVAELEHARGRRSGRASWSPACGARRTPRRAAPRGAWRRSAGRSPSASVSSPTESLLVAAQLVEDAQPGRVREGAEATGDQLGGIRAVAGSASFCYLTISQLLSC